MISLTLAGSSTREALLPGGDGVHAPSSSLEPCPCPGRRCLALAGLLHPSVCTAAAQAALRLSF